MDTHHTPGGGLFDRLWALSSLFGRLPNRCSDANVETLLTVAPPDTARALDAILVPRCRPVSVPFLKAIGRWLDRIHRAREQGRKVVLIPFNFPPEVVRIFENAEPLSCEVLTTLAVACLEGQGRRYWDQAMAMGLPDYLCSSSTITLGSLLSGNDLAPDIIVQSTAGACDANSKIHEFAARTLDVPQVFVEKPLGDGPNARAHHRRYFRRFVQQLGQHLGQQPDTDQMRRVLQLANAAGELHQEMGVLRRAVPCPIPNLFSIYGYATRFALWGTDDGVEVMHDMVEHCQRRLALGAYPAPAELARCVWLYVGYYFDLFGLFNWLEERGITYLLDVLSTYTHRPVDTRDRQSMLAGLAATVFDYPMTRQMGAPSMSLTWMQDMVALINELQATMAVFSGHHSCKQTWSVFAAVRQEITRRSGVPVLTLQGDAWDRRMTPIEAIQSDISSFMDTVVLPRGGRRRRKRRARGPR